MVTKALPLLARATKAVTSTLFCVDGEISGTATGPVVIERNGVQITTETLDWEFKWTGRIAIELLSDEIPDIIGFGPNPDIVQPVTKWTINGETVEVMGLAYVMPLVAFLQRSECLGRHIRFLCPSWQVPSE